MGLSVSFGFLLRLFSVGVFVRLSGASSSPLKKGFWFTLGSCGFGLPDTKDSVRPSWRGVCVRSGRKPCHQQLFLQQGAQGVSASPAPTKTLAVNS